MYGLVDLVTLTRLFCGFLLLLSNGFSSPQDENQELALDRSDGDVDGLVTATDAFEAITGELEDPLD